MEAGQQIHKLCGIYAKRYANRLALKSMDGEDLEEEIILRLLESHHNGKKYSNSELVRNARRDIFDVIEADDYDDLWHQEPDFEDEDF
jgi:Ran GTPase-activating protein (RanGAP) involved in mRNA processing and transport